MKVRTTWMAETCHSLFIHDMLNYDKMNFAFASHAEV